MSLWQQESLFASDLLQHLFVSEGTAFLGSTPENELHKEKMPHFGKNRQSIYSSYKSLSLLSLMKKREVIFKDYY